MSDQRQRAFSTAFKESVVLRLRAGERLAALADELGIRITVTAITVTVHLIRNSCEPQFELSALSP